jgi:hypothetical protein
MKEFVKFSRDGVAVWPYCSECGCRLKIHPSDYWNKEHRLTHFGLSNKRDARGCRCSNLFDVQITPSHRVAAFV